MQKILLPRLETTLWKLPRNKNIAVQLLANEMEIEPTIIQSGSGYVVIGSSEQKVCLVWSARQVPDIFSHVLLVNRKPDEVKLTSNAIRFKEWIKHPQMQFSATSDVIESWSGSFNYLEEDTEREIIGLRNPQIGAIHSVLGHLKVSDKPGIVVLPTGTGKTEVMLSVLIANKCGKVLVIVPSDALREQIFSKFLTLGLLKRFGIVSEDVLYPKVGILKQGFSNISEAESFFDACNVVVATMDVISNSSDELQEKIASMFSHLFIDEAHHTKATSWELFRRKFTQNKILQFTATPFRNDGKRLDGVTIFNFPLKKAQEQGYFKKINFIPIKKYSLREADVAIADSAVRKLREDIENGFDHILMARCETKNRAQDVFQLYEKHEDLNPIVIYSGLKNKRQIMDKIKKKEHKIIVAVDMLGEGFDLPELKIAAFHDIRKSLPITLQFAGRFTRTSLDQQLGDASFIANIADVDFKDELAELYSQNPDWNSLLSSISTEKIDDQIRFEEFIAGFHGMKDASIPFQNIKSALSTVVYRNANEIWQPENFINGLPDYNKSDYKFHDINHDKKILVIIKANRVEVDWVNLKDIHQLQWNLIVVFWEAKNNLLFIHSSDKSSLYENLAASILGEGAELINKMNVFKAFYGVNRATLQNVGLKEFLGKSISYRMSAGSDVEPSLSAAEKKKGQKALVFGTGYENGEKISLGCSYKGRIWSYAKGDLIEFQEWCCKLSDKLSNNEIDPNQILKDTLIPELKTERPAVFPVWIDWNEGMYVFPEYRYVIKIDGASFDLSNCELVISNPSTDGGLFFELKTDTETILLEKKLYQKDENTPDFGIINHSTGRSISIHFGTKAYSIEDFFYLETPTFWFADGSSLTGNSFVKLKQTISSFEKERLIAWNWSGVNLSKESQGISPKILDSIQYKVIDTLKNQDFDIIYDDDSSGEIADVIAIKEEEDKLKISFYHLKYANGGVVNNQINNFYEVCGQAQKSICWKHKNGDEIFGHLLRREVKRKSGVECSRIEKGSREDLERLKQIAKRNIPIEFEIFIVQPALSKAAASEEILTLLGVTDNFLMELAHIKLSVIVSD